MVIERNSEWGSPGRLGPDADVAADDAAARALLAAGTATMRLADGDLARTLGVAGRLDRELTGVLLPVDAIEVELDGRDVAMAVAHVVVGRPWGLRGFVAVMNAAYLGDANLAPRAHPGDGKFDVVEVALGWRDLLRARRRATTGTHVPHPGIDIRRSASWSHDFGRPTVVTIDGLRAGTARNVRCHLRSEALTIGI